MAGQHPHQLSQPQQAHLPLRCQALSDITSPTGYGVRQTQHIHSQYNDNIIRVNGQLDIDMNSGITLHSFSGAFPRN